MTRPLRCALLGLALLPAACVSFELGEVRVDQPPARGRAASIRPQESNLEDCLLALGAPAEVAELGAGAVLTWAWEDQDRWSVRVSFPLTNRASGYVQYADSDALQNRISIEFDRAWQVVRVLKNN